MRILAVDPGEKRIGIAISDPTGTIANPFMIIEHRSRLLDAGMIADLARQHEVQRIIVGQALDEEGAPTVQSRRAVRLAEVIRSQIDVPVEMWDESSSTLLAHQARLSAGARRHRRRQHVDDLAATVILQSYLDENPDRKKELDW